MFPFKFPYTNFHELNLDWILETTKSNTDRIAANELKIKLIGGDDPLNMLHPIGSIYMSTDSASPASLFGGEWEQLKDRFLIGAGGSYVAGGTAGEEEHRLTEEELPEHIFDIGLSTGGTVLKSGFTWTTTDTYRLYKDASGEFIKPYGGNQPHNNMPPYLAVYMWKRVN